MAAVDFGNVKTDAGLAKLNTHMSNHSYVAGFAPTQQDVSVFTKVLGAPPSKYPHAVRWYRHIASFTAAQRESWIGQKASKKEDNKKEDDDFDLFGEETAEEAVAKKAMKEAPKKEEKKKKVVINKSQLVIDVKPCSLDTNLDMVEKLVREIKIEGLEWSVTCKKLPIAFGLMKLQIGAVIVDDLVSTDDVIEKIECIGLNEAQAAEKARKRDAGDEDEEEGEEEEEDSGLVQSAEIVSFNKL